MKLYRNDRGGDFLARLSESGALRGTAGQALAALPWTRQDIASRSPLSLQNRLAVIGAGWVGRHRTGATGRDQLLALYLPGEICGYGVLLTDPVDTVLITLTPATLWTLSADDFLTVSEQHTEIVSSVLAALARERAISDEHLISIGSRNAIARRAHLICELQQRFAVNGGETSGLIEFPLSQTRLADYLCLSSVHVNRTLQALRRDGLIETQSRRIRVLDASKLAEIGGFKPSYLELPETEIASASS